MTVSSLITVTPIALEKIKMMLKNRGKPSVGIRLCIKTKGCSGLSYKLEYADEIYNFEDIIECEDFIKILIDSKCLMFVIGTQMDYEINNLDEGFIFRNPNEKGRCGCGESFYI